MNGDQIQFEIDNKDVPLRERSDWPLPSFDSRDWAEAMSKRFNVPQEELLPWCACMLMRGFDEHGRRSSAEMREFCGWLSGDIAELHAVEVPRLGESLERFLRRPDSPTPARSSSMVNPNDWPRDANGREVDG